MMTLMPVAAFAANPAGAAKADTSSFVATDGDQSITKAKADGVPNGTGASTANEGVEFIANLQDADEDSTTGTFLVWAVDASGARTSALSVDSAKVDSNFNVTVDDVVAVKATTANEKVKVYFSRSGKYTVYAGLAKNGAANVSSMSDINVFGEKSVITVTSAAEDPDTYLAAARGSDITPVTGNVHPYGVTYKDASNKDVVSDGVVGAVGLDANNVSSDKIYVKFMGDDTKVLKGETVTIESNSAAVEVNKTTATTNGLGEIDFKVSASIEGNYEVELSLNGVTWIVKVSVGDTGAAYIETSEQPRAAQALYGNLDKTDSRQGTKVRFNITDINGNVVKATVTGTTGYETAAATTGMGMNGIAGNANSGKYIVLTEKPASSNLESGDLKLMYSAYDQQWYLAGINNLDAEGTYTVKVILDNGATATATWEVKKFQTPVQLRIDTAVDTVALGGSIGASLTYVDANGVEKTAKDAKLTATGYAVANVSGTTVTAKSDEKYVGEKITVTAVSERYNLVANKEYTVVGEAVAVSFVDKNADVNVNNKLTWNLVDEDGNRIAIKDATDVKVQYVVLDKPADAKVTVMDSSNQGDLTGKGIGKMSLTSNKVGNVAVQVVVSAKFAATSNNAQQVKYYTGTQIFAVGNASAGDVVVMSIGSHEIVVNDKKATIDAAPMIQNDRTFVPFRALAEAFGAEVAYDEATQAVTAKLNGVEVVMTIGSATYTVNGTEKTADVAPFINGSRTMVPVRFAAEAFGIKVIPTYNPDGTTADILFNL